MGGICLKVWFLNGRRIKKWKINGSWEYVGLRVNELGADLQPKCYAVGPTKIMPGKFELVGIIGTSYCELLCKFCAF